MITDVPTRYVHPYPDAPAGRLPDSSMAVGAAAVTPRALPTVEADGHWPALAAAALLEPGAEVAPEPTVAELELDDGVELVPQAASAATAISPVSSDGRVFRWDIGWVPLFFRIQEESPGQTWH
jgi:hypothetical protein